MQPLLTTLAAVGALTVVLASVLAVANRRLHVEEDPRIDEVEGMLPATNCGACGFPGCRAFAEALVAGDALPGKCTVSSDDGRSRIATYLGVDVGTEEKRVARLACAGGSNVARNRAHYSGVASCAAAARIAGGPKGCTWGCIGLGDCEVACDFDALKLDAHCLPVVDVELCTACGDCVTACPKDLFSLQPISHRLWVACSSQLSGDDALRDCDVACDACGRCAKDSRGAIEMKRQLPVVDYSRRQHREAIERCPTGAIVWLDPQSLVRGKAAKRIVRKQPRAAAPT